MVKNNSSLFIKSLKYFIFPHRSLFVLGILLSIIGAIASLGLPLLLGALVNKESIVFILNNRSVIFIGITILLIIYIIQGLATYLLGKVGALVVKEMEATFVDCTLSLPLKAIESMSAGDLSSRLVNDISETAKVITVTIPHLIINSLIIIGTITILLSLNTSLTLIAILVIISILLGLLPLNKRIEYLYHRHHQFLGEISAVFTEKILNIKIVKTYLGRKQELIFFRNKFEKVYANFLKMVSILSILNTLTSALLLLLVLAFLLYTSWQVNNGLINFSEMIIFILYIVQIINPISDVFSNISDIFEVKGSLKRVIDIYHFKQKQITIPSEKNYQIKDGSLLFSDVSFSYTNEKTILNNINFAIPPKQLVALVGPSGSGKSTILSLLLKLYTDYDGEIILDGIPLKEISAQNIREQVACVLQNNHLFSGTIRENLLYGKNSGAVNQDIHEALKKSGVFDFIKTLPDGIDTLIEEDGNNLSEGQKQRLNIARALISQPKILVMDEMTSNLDSISEDCIVNTLLELRGAVTMLVVSHRLKTIEKADLVIVLTSEGKIDCIGRHESLLKESNLYQKLYKNSILNDRSKVK